MKDTGGLIHSSNDIIKAGDIYGQRLLTLIFTNLRVYRTTARLRNKKSKSDLFRKS